MALTPTTLASDVRLHANRFEVAAMIRKCESCGDELPADSDVDYCEACTAAKEARDETDEAYRRRGCRGGQ